MGGPFLIWYIWSNVLIDFYFDGNKGLDRTSEIFLVFDTIKKVIGKFENYHGRGRPFHTTAKSTFPLSSLETMDKLLSTLNFKPRNIREISLSFIVKPREKSQCFEAHSQDAYYCSILP